MSFLGTPTSFAAFGGGGPGITIPSVGDLGLFGFFGDEDEDDEMRRGRLLVDQRSTDAIRSGGGRAKDIPRRRYVRPRPRSYRTSAYGRLSATLKGAQPVVVKIASYSSLGASGGGAGTLVNYITRQGEKVGRTEQNEAVIEPEVVKALMADWAGEDGIQQRQFATFEARGLVPGMTDKDALDAFAKGVVSSLAKDRDYAYGYRVLETWDQGTVIAVQVTAAVTDRQGNRLRYGNRGKEVLAERASEAGLQDATASFRRTARTEGELAARLAALDKASTHGVRTDKDRALTEPSLIEAQAKRWANMVDEGYRPRHVMHLILSTRAGTPERPFEAAVDLFLRETFPDRRYIVAVHGPNDVPGKATEHQHAHVALKMRNAEGEQLRTSPQILFEWRERFADALREHGIEAVATRRHDRAHAPAYTAKEHGLVRAAEAGRDIRKPEALASAVARMEAKETRRVTFPTTEIGQRLADESFDALYRAVLEGPQKAYGQYRKGQTIDEVTEELTVAYYVTYRPDDAQTVGRWGEGMTNLTSELELSERGLRDGFARIAPTLTEERDRQALDNVLERVVELARDVAQQRDAQRQESQEIADDDRAPDTSRDESERDALGTQAAAPDPIIEGMKRDGDALLQRVRDIEDDGRAAYATYQDQLDAVKDEPWSEERYERARSLIVGMAMMDGKLNLTLAETAMAAARGNAYLDRVIDIQEEKGGNQALHKLRAFILEQGLHERDPAESDRVIRETLIAEGMSPKAAETQTELNRIVTLERDVQDGKRARDPADENRFVFDPVGSSGLPNFIERDGTELDGRAAEHFNDAIRYERKVGQLDRELDGRLREIATSGLQRSDSPDLELRGLALELERSEDRYRDRLALLALEAVRGDEKANALIEESGTDALRSLRDHIKDRGLDRADDPERDVLIAVRDDVTTETQNERWTRYEQLTYDEFRRTTQTQWHEHLNEDTGQGTGAQADTTRAIQEDRDVASQPSADADEAAARERISQDAYDAYKRGADAARTKRATQGTEKAEGYTRPLPSQQNRSRSQEDEHEPD